MTTGRKLSILVGVGMVLVAAAAIAGNEGRIAGTVVDPNGKPVADARVTVYGIEVETSKEATTNRKGKFSLLILDATRPYGMRIEADGYDTLDERIQLEIGGVLRGDWVLYPAGSSGPTEAEIARMESQNKAARLYNEGAGLYEAGQLQEALGMMDAALEESPDLPPALDAKARIYMRLADQSEDEGERKAMFEGSLAAANRLRELLPEERAPMEVAFEALLALDRVDEAATVLPDLVEIGQPRPAAVGHFKIGVVQIRANQLDAAKASFGRSVELAPDLKEAYLNLALIAQAEGDWGTVVAQADSYLEHDAGNSRALRMKYEAYQQLGEKEQADAAFSQLAAADPASLAESFYEQGVELWNNGQTDQAQSYFERVLEVAPDHPRAHFQLGLSFLSAGNIPRAKELLARFIELAPDDPEAATAREMLQSL